MTRNKYLLLFDRIGENLMRFLAGWPFRKGTFPLLLSVYSSGIFTIVVFLHATLVRRKVVQNDWNTYFRRRFPEFWLRGTKKRKSFQYSVGKFIREVVVIQWGRPILPFFPGDNICIIMSPLFEIYICIAAEIFWRSYLYIILNE